MDKTIYYRKNTFKLFGRTIWEKIEQYEGCDIENCKPIDPMIEQPVDLKFKDKKE